MSGRNVRRSRTRYLLALVFAAVFGLVVAVPVFAQESSPGDEGTAGEAAPTEETTEEEGGTVEPQVVGGTAVPEGKYRFMAAIRNVRNGSTAYQQQFCGGTLIDRDSVLTAAHCVEGATKGPLRVTVGRTKLNSGQGQTRSVAAIYRHPRYNGGASRDFDAAVLKLGSPVSGISPVKIPRSSSNGFETPGRDATVAGWGSTTRQPPSGGNQPSYPDNMREAKVPIVSDTRARASYGTSYTPALMVAAGEAGKDTCQGDSGGPIFVPTKTGRYQIGITSFGAGCGARGFPGVYAEANSASIRPFIFNAAAR